MKRIARLMLRALLLAVGLCLAVLLLVFQRTPLVATARPVSVEDVQRARGLLARHDPRRVPEGEANVVVLTQQDVTLLAQYGASRWRRAVTDVTLRDGTADVRASVDVSGNPFGRWLNIDATVGNADGLPAVQRVRIGRIPVPAALAKPVLRVVLARLGAAATLTMAEEMVHAIVFTPTSVRIAYTWQRGASNRVRDMLMPPEELQRLQRAHEELARVVASRPASAPLSLVTLLVPVLQQAGARADGGNIIGEYRAALLTLALYITGRPLGRYVRRAAAWSPIERRVVTLGGREDLAKHFLVSAVVASQSGSMLADAVGRTKEVDDARFGSGFSFVDIAADRAGTLFGELAVRTPARLQDAVTTGLREADLLPAVADLPESMTEAEFTQRFGGIDAPAYRAMMTRIETRLAALPLYRP